MTHIQSCLSDLKFWCFQTTLNLAEGKQGYPTIVFISIIIPIYIKSF